MLDWARKNLEYRVHWNERDGGKKKTKHEPTDEGSSSRWLLDCLIF